jgi:hypothetical protein
MAELPMARVVRVGAEQAREDAVPPAPVLRLAPRAIPRRLVWRMLFGTSIARFGWLFALIGSAVMLGFAWDVEVPFRNYDRTAMARVTNVEQIRSSEEKDGPRYRVHFSFVDHAGVEHHGASYTRKDIRLPRELPVEYVADRPSRARLIGMAAKPGTIWIMAFTILFPIVGIALAMSQFRVGRRDVRLLRYGVETEGRLVSKTETRVTVNKTPIMALVFEYQANDGKTYTTTVKTLTPEPLEDDAREKMLYDPYAPERATPLDHLPGQPVVTSTGEIDAKPGIAVHVLIVPMLTLALIVTTVIRIVIAFAE